MRRWCSDDFAMPLVYEFATVNYFWKLLISFFFVQNNCREGETDNDFVICFWWFTSGNTFHLFIPCCRSRKKVTINLLSNVFKMRSLMDYWWQLSAWWQQKNLRGEHWFDLKFSTWYTMQRECIELNSSVCLMVRMMHLSIVPNGRSGEN